MENIKLEEELKLETILLSLNKNNLSKLNDIIDLKEVDLADKQLLRKYIYMTQNSSDSLSIETLKKEFPALYFDNTRKLKTEDELDDYIRLYIADIKNKYTAKQLIGLANIIRTNGITEEVSTKLTNLTKSDIVSIPYKDIGDNIIDIYNTRKLSLGIQTGVPRIDEDTGGLQLGTVTTLLRIYPVLLKLPGR